jgi:hypothetical protein
MHGVTFLVAQESGEANDGRVVADKPGARVGVNDLLHVTTQVEGLCDPLAVVRGGLSVP